MQNVKESTRNVQTLSERFLAVHLKGLFAAFIEARCVSHVKNERICERNLFVARRVARREAGKLCEEGITGHKARQLLGIALHMARPFTHTHTLGGRRR